jgi:hypothetical protein
MPLALPKVEFDHEYDGGYNTPWYCEQQPLQYLMGVLVLSSMWKDPLHASALIPATHVSAFGLLCHIPGIHRHHPRM